MRLVPKFISNSIYCFKNAIVLMKTIYNAFYVELTNFPQDNTAAKTRFDIMYSKLTKEQFERINTFIKWLRVMWVINIVWLVSCIYYMDIYAGFFILTLSIILYIFPGYRIWILNTGLYPTFPKYIKMLAKYPTASLPIQIKRLK